MIGAICAIALRSPIFIDAPFSSTDEKGFPTVKGEWNTFKISGNKIHKRGLTNTGIKVELIGTMKKQAYLSSSYGSTPTSLSLSPNVSVIGRGDPDKLSADEAEMLELYGILYSHAIAFDHRSHFAMFTDKLVEDRFTSEARKLGYSYDEALKHNESVLRDILPYSKVTMEYTIQPIPISLSEGDYGWFEDAGMDVGLVSDIRMIGVENMKFTFDGGYVMEFSDMDSGLELIKYDGKWCPAPKMIDDDISIDLLQSVPDSDRGYYREKVFEGTIESINDNMIKIGDEVFYVGDVKNAKDLKVGEYVSIMAYSGLGIGGIKSNTGEDVEMYRAIKIDRVDIKTESI